MPGGFGHGLKYLTFIFPRGISNLNFSFSGEIKAVSPTLCRERGSGIRGINLRALWDTWSFLLFLASQREDYACLFSCEMKSGASAMSLSWFSLKNV